MKDDKKWMRIAIKEALKAKKKGEVPVGAVLVQNNKIIAKAHNQPILQHDPTAHAEIQVLQDGGKKNLNYRLREATVYVTLEPCMMCLGAMIHARIERLVFGDYDEKESTVSLSNYLRKNQNFNHQIHIEGGEMQSECKRILKEFFKNKRK